MLSVSETIPASEAIGRVAAMTAVACPPAVPIVVSGEKITESDVEAFTRCGITEVEVVR